MVTVPFSANSKEYGYIMWPKRMDNDIQVLLGDAEKVQVVFNGNDLGTKRVDWKSRRISVGYKQTRHLTIEHKKIQLEMLAPNKLIANFS